MIKNWNTTGKIKAIIIVFCVYSCSQFNSGKIFGTYEAFYCDTKWTLTLNSDSSFNYGVDWEIDNIVKDGRYHISGDTLVLERVNMHSNKFLIDGDSCLIDIESRYDYCKQWPKVWGSRIRNINYPQLPTENEDLKKDLEWMLQIALDNKEISEYISDTAKTLVIQEYYEINKESNLNLNWNGKEIQFLSKSEIKEQNLKSYIIIDEIKIGLESSIIDFMIMPKHWQGTITLFKKKDGIWKHVNID